MNLNFCVEFSKNNALRYQGVGGWAGGHEREPPMIEMLILLKVPWSLWQIKAGFRISRVNHASDIHEPSPPNELDAALQVSTSCPVVSAPHPHTLHPIVLPLVLLFVLRF